MSLINEALKKAQKQRTGETPLASLPAIGGESAERIARRAKPAGSNSLLLGLGLGVAGLAVVIVGGVLLLRNQPSTQPPAVITQLQPGKPAEPISPTVTAPVVTSGAPPAAAATIVIPVAPASAPPPAKIEPPVVIVETPKPVALPTVTPVATKPEPVKAAAPPTKLEPRAINYIESLRVAGIRASTTDSKVLMNDRVYRIGSIVEHEMGLKLTGITSSSLTFEDEHGGSYTRTF